MGMGVARLWSRRDIDMARRDRALLVMSKRVVDGDGVARLVGNRAETLDFVDGRGGGSIRESTSPKIEPGHSILWVVG